MFGLKYGLHSCLPRPANSTLSMNRRNFVSGVLKSAVLFGAGYAGTASGTPVVRLPDPIGDPSDQARDEAYWEQVRDLYELPPQFLYLNNGGASATPKEVFSSENFYREAARTSPSYYLWRSQTREREVVRETLADFLTCSKEEIALLRSTTEALVTVIQGLELPAGSEILTTSQDYPTMVHTLDLYAKRRGWIVRTIDLPVPLLDHGDTVRRFREAITSQTRFMLISDILYSTGERMPVRQLCNLAAEKDILVAVDGAHTVGQYRVCPQEFGCHFFASSMHKWLSAPIGTGMLWVRKDMIESLWPMYGAVEGEEVNIRKFEHIGTRPMAADLAVRSAIDLTIQIGLERKLARLRYLTSYWWNKLREMEGIVQMTNMDSPERYGGIAAFKCPKKGSLDLDQWLLQEKRIIITRMRHEGEVYFRISPHVFILPRDLDFFVKSVTEYLS